MKATILKKRLFTPILILATICSSSLAIKKNIENTNLDKELKKAIQEKEIAQKKLDQITNSYENINHKNKKLSKRVIKETNKIISLKNSVDKLDTDLKADKKVLSKKTYIAQNLTNENKALADEIKKAKALEITAVSITPMRKKLNGKFIKTTKTKKTDAFKVSFQIQKNTIAAAGEKRIQLQLINPENEIILVKEEALNKNTSMYYSDEMIIDYNNELLDVITLIAVNREELISGQYEVKTFIDGDFITKSNFNVN